MGRNRRPNDSIPGPWISASCRHLRQASTSSAHVLNPQLDPRSRHLLRALIAQYVRDGVPVGSRTLARQAGLDISPATIRNVMADLEDIGLVTTPHTSAGRVPTAQGYRLFVDSLLQVEPLDSEELARLGQRLPVQAGTRDLVSNVSELLSAMTQFVGLVTVPKREQFALRHIDFVQIDPARVLVILVFADNEVQNRIVRTRRPYSAAELEQTANYLNQNFTGTPLSAIRAQLQRELREAGNAMARYVAVAADVAETAFVPPPGDDVLVAGQTHLIGVQELSDLDRVRELFETFSRKKELLQLLEGCITAQGVRLYIGEESGVAPLEQCSVVTAPYGADGKVLGVLGVIGPTRMAYERVIPMVQGAAQVLGAALNRQCSAQ